MWPLSQLGLSEGRCKDTSCLIRAASLRQVRKWGAEERFPGACAVPWFRKYFSKISGEERQGPGLSEKSGNFLIAAARCHCTYLRIEYFKHEVDCFSQRRAGKLPHRGNAQSMMLKEVQLQRKKIPACIRPYIPVLLVLKNQAQNWETSVFWLVPTCCCSS